MNCAYHADQSAVAYCRTCGKALCSNCTRPVRGVIYCEDCLGRRMETGAPAGGFVAPTAPMAPPPPISPTPGSSGPNPTVAGILGAIPFGIGAVYNGQYTKGLVHLGIFAVLIAGMSTADRTNSDALGIICGLGMAFFWVYQIVDAVRSARAIQAGLPNPDPFGLAATFGAGAGTKADTSKAPVGAIVLILLGVLFLLHTVGLFELGFDRFWPVLLMALGVWLFARNMGWLGGVCDANTRCQRLMGPVMLFTIGTLFLLQSLDVAGFHRTWPVILLAVGAVKLLQRSNRDAVSTSTGGGVPPSEPPPPPTPPTPPSEVSHG